MIRGRAEKDTLHPAGSVRPRYLRDVIARMQEEDRKEEVAIPESADERHLVLDRYDAGLLSGMEGMSAEWWQDYIRAELDRAHDFYQSQADAALASAPAGAGELALTQDKLCDLRFDEREVLIEQRDALRRALEVIAVGDSKNPAWDAADELVALGFWSAEAVKQFRAALAGEPAVAAADEGRKQRIEDFTAGAAWQMANADAPLVAMTKAAEWWVDRAQDEQQEKRHE